MHRPDKKRVLALLVKVYNQSITDYFYFPDIIYAGNQKMERGDFDYLLAEGFIALSKFDSFGCYYALSKKGDHKLQRRYLRTAKKKTAPVPLIQGCLYFNRFKNPHLKDARCLLFL